MNFDEMLFMEIRRVALVCEGIRFALWAILGQITVIGLYWLWRRKR